MGFRQTPPGEGKSGSGIHFAYMGTACGAKWNAFTAGPCVWLECHPAKKTKPCCAEITGGELVCQFCGVMPPVKTLGWLPVWREVDYRPGVVVLYEHQRGTVDTFGLHDRVLIGREADQSDGTWVAPALAQGKRFTTALEIRKVAHDVSHSLLRMWKLPALTAWFERSEASSEKKTVSLPKGTAVDSRGEEFSPALQNAAKRYGADVIPDDEQAAEVARNRLRALVAGIGTPSPNGNGHKRPPKKG